MTWIRVCEGPPLVLPDHRYSVPSSRSSRALRIRCTVASMISNHSGPRVTNGSRRSSFILFLPIPSYSSTRRFTFPIKDSSRNQCRDLVQVAPINRVVEPELQTSCRQSARARKGSPPAELSKREEMPGFGVYIFQHWPCIPPRNGQAMLRRVLNHPTLRTERPPPSSSVTADQGNRALLVRSEVWPSREVPRHGLRPVAPSS